MRTNCLSLLALSSALASFTARDARACSPPACDPIVVAPAEGASVPANFPGFPVLDETRRAPPDAGLAETALTLHGPDGQIIPLERRPLGAGSALYVPQKTLLPGPHQLAFVSNCNQSVGGQPPPPEVVRNVNVVAAAPLPTLAGQVTTSASFVPTYTVAVGNGSCFAAMPVSLVRVALTPSADLAPYLPLARLTVTVDGFPWATSVFGGGTRHAPNPYLMPEHEALEIFATCRDGRLSASEEGEHRGELTVELPGAAALPAVPFSFRFDCSGATATAGSPSGCSYASASRGPSRGPGLLLGLVWLALWRRRRARSCRGDARRIRRFLVAALLLGTACESGWDIRGAVLTEGVTNKSRPLGVFLLTQRTLDRDHLPTEKADYLQVASADVIPPDQLRFSHSNFGCHAGAVVLIAWAPKSAPAAGASAAAKPVLPPFAPQSGDLLVVSDVLSPYCGVQTKYEEVTLVLDDSKTAP
jgi:MYXO-CTERM domain-containing protein